MAGASMNDIKARIKSVTGTMQITKAMELVATSKLRRQKERAEKCRPFYEVAGEAIDGILSSSEAAGTVYLSPRPVGKTLYVVIAGDRGLAGGYNSNLFRMTKTLSAGQDAAVLPIGKKAVEHFRLSPLPVVCEDYPLVAPLGVGDCMRLGEDLCRRYAAGEFDRVILIYTRFVSMLTQKPVYEQLLPLERDAATVSVTDTDPLCDGEDVGEMLATVVPTYLGGVCYSAVCESVASESGARRTAMNAASKNASEMMDDLMLRYNRARQAIITQEITEIVSGAEAL